MSLANIAQYLEDQGIGVQGQTIFVDTKPQSAPAGTVLLRQSGGYADPDYCGQLRETNFQATISDKDYVDGLALAEQVSSTLQIRQKSIGSGFYFMVYPENEPIPFGREASGQETIVVNFVAKWRLL